MIEVKTFLSDIILKEAKKISLSIDKACVLETPVDTGAARGSWLASAGIPNSSIPSNTSSGSALGQAAVAIGSARPYQTIYIQNNQPYIGELNDGSSQQAPAKFIDRIITRHANA